MTFFQKAQKFLTPLYGNKLLTILSMFKFGAWAIFTLVSVLLIRQSVELYDLGDIEGLKNIGVYYIIFSCVYLIITWFLRMTDWPYLYYEIVRVIYDNYLRKLFYIDGNYIERIGTGKMIAIISQGEKTWVEGLTNLIKEGTRLFIIFGFVLYISFHTDFWYGAAFIVLLFVINSIILYADNIAHKHRKERTEKKNEHTRQLVRIIMSRNEILQSGGIENEMIKNSNIISEIGDTSKGINSALFLIFNSVRVFIIVLKIGFILFLVYLEQTHRFSTADIAGILALFLVLEGFMYDFVEFYKNFTKDFSDIEKLWDTFDKAPTIKGYDSGSTFIPQNFPIEIRDITYGYNESKVFENFSLTLEKGKKAALVGASGGGKTTLMKLIAGYLHPESGSISVMGNILSDTALKTYYPHIGYLTQDPGVFDATIRENLISAISSVSDVSSRRDPFQNQEGENNNQDIISKGKRDSSVSLRNDKTKNIESTVSPITLSQDERLINALKLAQCDFVFELEHGLDTEIGERGVRLSGGQKQRLAIAKIFLKDPEIILLDEPTSALDSFSEEKITEALDILFKNRTVIIVAHRLQTVKKADDIIVIEGGEVIERGTHTELVEKDGVYNRMLELQSGF